MHHLTHDLRVTLVQTELAWEQPADNRQHFADTLRAAAPVTDVIVLPEMFTTGFSMNAIANAEAVGGDTEAWLLSMAKEFDCAVTGSIAVRDGEVVYNRMLFTADGEIAHYDKRHLFRMAGEHKRYAEGSERVIVDWRGWRIALQVCYDLRFPVFSRNRGDYDALLYVANWPARRASHWRALLPARAIENIAYVAAVNRIGADANGLDYSGDSMAIDAEGKYLVDLRDREAVETVVFSAQALRDWREAFPAHLDADAFSLTP